MNKKLLCAAGIIVFVAVLSLGLVKFINLNNASETCVLNVPEEMASLPRTQFISGPEAISQISKLHGKEISLEEGHIARYQAEGKEITLWISVSPTKEEGEALFKVMDQKMPSSKAFTNREVNRVGSRDVIKVQGMGQKHFYWVSGKYNYWVAVAGMDALPVIEEVLIKLE